jgi:hypothetical protein
VTQKGVTPTFMPLNVHQAAFMSTAFVHISVICKRMLTRREAAEHCGRSLARFDAECPIVPVRFPNGDLRYDRNDLDHWLDKLKDTTEDSEHIIERLGKS